ncbi:hypothetical protein, partial [uncultured Thiodictyon sp.]|uniref:hypothetical protein n=1 Tax=uncultured Thiodictyon sp. TaxID=1846217 RepID=UPI0025F54780
LVPNEIGSYLRGSTATKRFKMHEPLADARAAKNGIRDERRVFCQALGKQPVSHELAAAARDRAASSDLEQRLIG